MKREVKNFLTSLGIDPEQSTFDLETVKEVQSFLEPEYRIVLLQKVSMNLNLPVIVMFIWTENFDSQNRGNKSGEIIWKGSCPAAKPIYIMRDGEEYSAINSPLNVLRNRSFCSFCGIIFTQKTIHRWDNYCFIPHQDENQMRIHLHSLRWCWF